MCPAGGRPKESCRRRSAARRQSTVGFHHSRSRRISASRSSCSGVTVHANTPGTRPCMHVPTGALLELRRYIGSPRSAEASHMLFRLHLPVEEPPQCIRRESSPPGSFDSHAAGLPESGGRARLGLLPALSDRRCVPCDVAGWGHWRVCNDKTVVADAPLELAGLCDQGSSRLPCRFDQAGVGLPEGRPHDP
jgi:hypothetical protein